MSERNGTRVAYDPEKVVDILAGRLTAVQVENARLHVVIDQLHDELRQHRLIAETERKLDEVAKVSEPKG